MVAMTLVWGTTFPLVKTATENLSPAALVAIRFLIAALALSPWLRFNTRLWRDGFVLGVLLFVTFITQVVGLGTISSTRGAFITGLNVILIPIFAGFIGRLVPRNAYWAAALALLGIGAMSFEGGAFSIGDAWVLACAVSYAVYVLILEAVAHHHDPMQLTAVQLMVVALLGLIWSAPELVQHGLPHLQPSGWASVVYLGLVATAGTTFVQALAQRWVAAFEAAVIYALEPVFAAVFSFAFLGETLGWRGLVGGALILGAMVFSQRATVASVHLETQLLRPEP
jgi:drug/metabolite transporter (DMT)-like permease